MYRRGHGDSLLLLGVYVDDLIITGSAEAEINRFKEEMKAMFRMSDLGLLSFYLGIEVQQSSSGITLCQAHYAKRILEMAGMQDCNPAHTPIEEWLKLSRDSTATEVDITQYWRIIGSLRYPVHTRLDLAFSVGYMSRFMERPMKEHMAAMKMILCYVAGMLSLGCHYGRTAEARLVGYTDNDLASDVDTRRSTSDDLFFYGSNLVRLHALKQKVVALSSSEVEYVAATTIATQAVWLARLLGDFKGRDASIIKLKIDNNSTLALIQNPVFHERSKHIDVRYHFIRECREDGRISADFISTMDQLADIQTKALGRDRFHELRARIGMVNINSISTHKD
ncbi:uncharacterized mitochondrial protein AtMg00810-like [Phragmites australis]|uniref:uncharacterized mitochondrial protein AtMg00810-like n=1 Tax=Phragmites australis TaxID=29695 RepID=UPI002D773C53|nr:uncharacterized mitochondrial protein AtMg00810-like [Phragmites australis]